MKEIEEWKEKEKEKEKQLHIQGENTVILNKDEIGNLEINTIEQTEENAEILKENNDNIMSDNENSNLEQTEEKAEILNENLE